MATDATGAAYTSDKRAAVGINSAANLHVTRVGLVRHTDLAMTTVAALSFYEANGTDSRTNLTRPRQEVEFE
jgi:hypothetical protein